MAWNGVVLAQELPDHKQECCNWAGLGQELPDHQEEL